MGDPNISFGQVTTGYTAHRQQSLFTTSSYTNPTATVTDAALESDSAGGFEDLKLLDFPIYDPDEDGEGEANFDEASLEEMFSPTSGDDPNSPSSYVPSVTRPGVTTPTTTCSASSFASTSPAPSVRSRTHSEHMDIVMSSSVMGGHSNPISVEIPSPSGSNTPTLPSFLETYSPRYRTGLVSGASSTSSHHQQHRHHVTSAIRPQLVQQSSTDAFFKYDDLMDDEEGSSLSSEPVLGTESLGHDSPTLVVHGPMPRSTSRTSSPFVSNIPSGLAFMKQEQFDTFDQLANTPPMTASHLNVRQPLSPVVELFSDQAAGLVTPGLIADTGNIEMGRPSSMVIKREPSSRRSSKQSNQSFPSSGHRSSLGRSSIGSIGSVSSLDQGRFASYSPSLSTHSTISPPLTPMTPPRTRGAIHRKGASATETLGGHHHQKGSAAHQRGGHSQQSQSKSGQQKSGSASGSSASTASSSRSSASSSSAPLQQESSSSLTTASRDSGHGSSATTSSHPARSVCAVCGDIAACQHYGVRTCEGCKGFFKRTVQKGAKYVCLGGKDCVVDKRRRNRCQFCRFQKCLAVGMVKEVVRTDDLKGRRGRLPSKPKSPQESPPSPPVSTITALVRAHLDTNPDLANLDVTQVNNNVNHSRLPLFANQQSFLFVTFLSPVLSIKMSQVTHENVTEESVHSFYRIFHSSLDTIRAFGDKIPGFNELDKLDQQLLYQVSVLELFSLRFAFRYVNKFIAFHSIIVISMISNTFDSERMVFCNGIVLHRSQVELIFGSKWFNSIKRLSQHLADMDLDISALACLCALSLINGKLRQDSCDDQYTYKSSLAERHGLSNETKVEQLQMKVISSLRDHCTYNADAQKKSWYFSKILSILPELRTLSNEGMDRMQQLNRIISMPDNLRNTLMDFGSTSSSY